MKGVVSLRIVWSAGFSERGSTMTIQRFLLNDKRHLIGIMAIDEAGGIGKDGIVPWDNPEDRAFFKAQTMGHTIIVGRKTFESWGGKPLPGRPCAVWTRNPNQFDSHCFDLPLLALSDVYALVEWGFAQSDIVYVCGGKMLYETLWSHLTDLIVTLIPGNWNCDIQMNMDYHAFECVQRLQFETCSVLHWERVG